MSRHAFLLRKLVNKVYKGKSNTRRRQLVIECLEGRKMLAAWVSQGPFGATNGQVENIAGRPVVGAVHALLAHPTNADVLYAGATNGGVWKTTNATASTPSWTAITDDQSSLSIGALAFDLADPTFQTVFAGNGSNSSYGRIGGGRDGLLKTTDGGTTWTRLNGGGTLSGKNVSGIVVNGNTIVVSVNIADSFTYSNIGIYRSSNGGATFSQLNNSGATSGLPLGISYDLIVDPNNSNVLYTSIAIPSAAGTQGVYKSINGGANWSRVSNATMDAQFTSNTSNVELAAGNFGEVYAAILNGGVLVGLYRSANSGSTWVAMDIPVTNENGTNVGLNPGGPRGNVDDPPEVVAGGQGAIHFSMVADPSNPNIVYVGGDRQPRTFGDTGSFPNSIGAVDFSGRLFRGDASQAAGSQFVHLTHSNSLGANGGGTASSSSPHADSRDMVFNAAGTLIESDDGGVYRRTSPQSDTGDWFSMIGNLANTEMHDVTYDTVSNIYISGNQDTGTTYQPTSGASTWDSVSTADGGDVAVDTIALAGSSQSIRYSSFQNLGGFRRRIHNASGGLVSTAFPSLTVTSGAPLTPGFRTPFATNAVAGSRLLIQAANGVYESLNQGTSLTQIAVSFGSNDIQQDAIAYGGMLGGNSFADVLWIAAGSNVGHRPPSGVLANTASQPVSSTIRDLAVDPDAYTTAAIVTSGSVYFSTNSGSNWTNITGNLPSAPNIRSIAYVPGIVDAIVVGTRAGIYATSIGQLGQWFSFGTNFPNALVPEVVYDSSDDTLIAGTMGRGAWSMSSATAAIMETLGAPTDITLSNNTSSEANSVPTTIGSFSTNDTTPSETFTYTLVSGTGSDDNTNFTISGNELRTGVTFDFETKPNYSIRVRSTDAAGWWTEKAFSITVSDVNEAPTVSLENVISMLAENANSATRVKVADIAIQDDALGTETLSVVGADSAKFEIDSNVLYVRSGVTLDYETQIGYVVQVQIDDPTLGASPDSSAPYSLTLTDVNEFSVSVPADIDSNTDGISETAPVGSIVGITAQSFDMDGTNNTVTYSLAVSADGRFQIHPTTGVITLAIANLDYEIATMHTILVTASSSDGSVAQKSFGIPVANIDEAVLLTRANATVSGNVNSLLSNSGTWSDPENGTVTLTASLGTVIKNNDGTWTWSFNPTNAIINQTVTITANDGTNSSTVTFTATAFATIQGRNVFYNNATGALLSSTGAAQNAIDTSKTALRISGTPSAFANYTNYSRGLNGVIVDIAGLPPTATDADVLSSLQFAQWNGIDIGGFGALLPAAIQVVTRYPGSGANGSTRVKIVFPDNTVQNTWLRITILANGSTGLQANDEFYFGHVLADVDVGNTPTAYRVNADDVSAARANQSGFPNTATVTNRYDLNKDGRVNADDVSIMRANQQGFGIVAPITVP